MTLDHTARDAISTLGYTPREAAFLALVAHHSGYFVRRQFLQWIGSGPGQTVVDFTHKLLVRRHATVQTFCYATHVYHLSARVLYAAAAAPTSHRRRRVALAVKARLMALDYVLARPDLHFLTRDEERLAYCDALGIDRAWLPQRRYCGFRSTAGSLRYFVEAAPMGLLREDEVVPTLVCAYIDDGTASVSGFETYVRDYRRLWVSVPRWRLVYIADAPRRLADAVVAFRRVCCGTGRAARSARTPAPSCRCWTTSGSGGCMTRSGGPPWTRRLLTGFVTCGVDSRGHDWEVLYGQWEARGDEAIRRVLSAPVPARTLNPSGFESCVLGHSYVATSPVRRPA